MPQSSIPDLNTGYITYRREILFSINHKRYSDCIGSLINLNALLPKEYQVKISTIEYNKLVKESVIAVCPDCKTEFDYQTLKIQQILLNSFQSIMANSHIDKVWFCNNCHKTNRLQLTQIKKKSPQQPYFLQVVPKPPQRKDGMMDRMTYDKKFTSWAWNFFAELENMVKRYRIEYVPKEGENESGEIMDGGEENEKLESFQ